MNIFDLMKDTESHEVVFFEEPSVGLKAIVAVNNTVLGPAMATCRLYDFDDVSDALDTALNMAYYNTFRSALMRRDFGGASIVLIGNPKKLKTEMYFRALGIFVNKLNGKLLLARSSGLTYNDMLDIKRESDYILGLNEQYKNKGLSPVEAIAKGMIWGAKAAVKEKMDITSLKDLTVVVQGVGDVGSNVVKGLLEEKANIIVSDLVYDKIKVIQDQVPNIKVVKPDEIYSQKCDIFITCAFNNLITEDDIEQLNCKILTGSVNSILQDYKTEKRLKERDILYVPGFVINTGEVIQFSNEIHGNPPEKVEEELSEIYHTTLNILKKTKAEDKTVRQVALDIAKKYINDVASIKMLK